MFLAVVAWESRRKVDTDPWALPHCWLSHSLFSLLNTAADLIFWHPPFPIHCSSTLSQLYSWSQATTSLCCHPGCHGRKDPWGPLWSCIAPICIFLFLTISFAVHWLVSKPVLWKDPVNTWKISVYTILVAVIKQIIKQMMKQINISSKQNGDAEIKDVIGARKHKEDEVLPSSSSFPNVPTMRKRQTDLIKRHTKIKQSWDTNLQKAKIFYKY